MNRQVELGPNKTGIATATELAAQMVQGTTEFLPSSPGDDQEIARVRGEYSERVEPLGSIPPPAMEAGTAQLVGEQALMSAFMDKLGARLAFERTGVRLYSALLSKFDTYGSFGGGPERSEIEHIRDEELEHFHTLSASIESLGGDPTAVTPGADVQATLSKGIMEVLVDPRTTLVQGLEAVLLAELADNDCWTTLSTLAEQLGQDDLAVDFEEAETHEREHLELVRSWLAAATSIAAT
jgi:rubrerythrin